ncbi:hypothetical protein TNCT_580191 [Trichonephila clavata]|uniref:Uncharacterized protein n=1 Tax=Trichonephila clavata TaxID=2740835 RepID=A0A8X6LSH2_TRICU|nr:hypothetical protein TNCT_580191 [Trichonephila clavata]
MVSSNTLSYRHWASNKPQAGSPMKQAWGIRSAILWALAGQKWASNVRIHLPGQAVKSVSSQRKFLPAPGIGGLLWPMDPLEMNTGCLNNIETPYHLDTVVYLSSALCSPLRQVHCSILESGTV